MIFQEGHDVLRRNDNLQEPDDVINTIYDRYPKWKENVIVCVSRTPTGVPSARNFHLT